MEGTGRDSAGSSVPVGILWAIFVRTDATQIVCSRIRKDLTATLLSRNRSN